jgi:GTP-binding protein EngB required for normal cell division
MVATKADKLSQSEINKQVREINGTFFGEREGKAILYSSKSGRGKKELWSRILSQVEGHEAGK